MDCESSYQVKIPSKHNNKASILNIIYYLKNLLRNFP